MNRCSIVNFCRGKILHWIRSLSKSMQFFSSWIINISGVFTSHQTISTMLNWYDFLICYVIQSTLALHLKRIIMEWILVLLYNSKKVPQNISYSSEKRKIVGISNMHDLETHCRGWNVTKMRSVSNIIKPSSPLATRCYIVQPWTHVFATIWQFPIQLRFKHRRARTDRHAHTCKCS